VSIVTKHAIQILFSKEVLNVPRLQYNFFFLMHVHAVKEAAIFDKA